MRSIYERHEIVVGNEHSAMNLEFITQALSTGSSAHVGNLLCRTQAIWLDRDPVL